MTEAAPKNGDNEHQSWRPRIGQTLSGRLLLLTILFVMLAEVLIYVPSIANYRANWLAQRLATAQIASLALEATMGEDVKPELETELLSNAGALQVSLQRNQTRILMLGQDAVPMIDARFDLRDRNPFHLIRDAFEVLFLGGERILLVKGTPGFEAGELIEVLIEEKQLKADMLIYSRNILALSIIISVLSALLIFARLRSIFVNPMNRLAANMVAFRAKPEDATRIIEPQSDVKEIHVAEQELSAMQTELRNSLQQKTRLAALGTAVSKINHDLRNILASAQLISDRLSHVDDPNVQNLAPKLVSSIDRAVDLASNTLKFGKVEEPPPRKTHFELRDLVDDVEAHVNLASQSGIQWQNTVEKGVTAFADSDQLFRILLNLARNAAQAMETCEDEDQNNEIKIATFQDWLEGAEALSIDIVDTGPGIPEKAKEHLFEAFSGTARRGGTGLGLAIAHELTLAHGGVLSLIKSDSEGTCFRISLPTARLTL